MKKNLAFLNLLMVGLVSVSLLSGCGGSERDKSSGSTSSSASSSSSPVTGTAMEQEFRDITKGTIEAAGTDSASFKTADGNDFSWDKFDAKTPGYCGKTEEGKDKGIYRLTLENNLEYSEAQYEAKVDAVWDYWESRGLSPQNIRPSENSRSIAMKTKSGGEMTYSAGKYGEFITSDSACSEKLVPVLDKNYAPPRSSDSPDF